MKRIISIALLLWITGCAPSLDDKVSISPIPTPLVRTHVRQVLRRIRVDPFDDMRTEKWIAEIKGGRRVEARDDVSNSVQDALARGLTAAGFTLDESAPYGLAGDVKRWMVNVEVDFPSSKAVAEAVLDMYVLDAHANILFSARYGGSATSERPMIEDQISQLLKDSMQLAIGEAIDDEKLLRVLKTY